MANDSPRIAAMEQWLVEPPRREVADALERLRRADDVQYVAVMPDVHLADDVCVGTAMATSRLIYPGAVGGDIGCGMAAMSLGISAQKLQGDRSLAGQVLASLYRRVPSNRHPSRRALPAEIDPGALSDERLRKLAARDGAVQLGTLGRGNHFLEFQADEQDNLWLMVHTGSRAIGQAVRDHHVRRAVRNGTGLLAIDAASEAGQAYLRDAEWAVRYADANRVGIVRAAAEIAGDLLGASPLWQTLIRTDHNHIRRETHFAQTWWVHRKGAMPADEGAAGMIPGSMGTESVHVSGRGNPLSLRSSAHGAGRKLSRDEARRSIGVASLERQLKGIWFDHRAAAALREEAPGAYKDVRAVLRAQRDLVRIERQLRPVLVYKGS